MNHIFSKLNYKGEKRILVLNPPESFRINLEEMLPLTSIDEEIVGGQVYEFIFVFVEKADQINDFAQQIKDILIGDASVWFAYPKKSSKQYKSEITRDSGWQPLGDSGYEPVRQVSIDDDWSALRFRNVDYIKKFDRDPKMAISEGGKKRLRK